MNRIELHDPTYSGITARSRFIVARPGAAIADAENNLFRHAVYELDHDMRKLP